MARRKNKFLLIWLLILALAAAMPLHGLIIDSGYTSLQAFFADALGYTMVSSLLIVPAGVYLAVRRLRRDVRLANSKTQSGSAKAPARCFRCKKPLINYVGARCRFCNWIRCSCGACGCG